MTAEPKPRPEPALQLCGKDIQPLIDLVDVLLDPQKGCPWDLEQNVNSLLALFPMEVAELREAAQNRDWDGVVEEAGDCMMLLLLILSKVQQVSGGGQHPARDAIQRVCNKIITRHTWIFGSDQAASPEEVERLWEANKRREKS